MTKNEAIDLLQSYVQSDSLRTHCLCVGTSMKYYAQLFHQDQELWEVGGILHDLDYEKYPEVHPDKCIELLRSFNENEDMIHAIMAHRYNEHIESLFDKALFACDELSGFVYACILVRPTKKIDGMEVSSVKKKIKDKGFARAVSREDIFKGAELLNISLDEHIQNVITAFTKERETLDV